MIQVHVVIRRINPAFKVDLVQVGRIKDGQFDSLPLEAIADMPISHFLEHTNISDSLHVDHSKIHSLVATCGCLPGFGLEFFDNTLVVIFDFNLNCDEGATEKEG